MKQIILIVAVLYSVLSYSQSDSIIVKGATQYVFSFSGLNLRSGPSIDSYILDKLTHGTPVEVIATSMEEEELGNRKSRWMKVSVDAQEGYLFGGYLSEHEPPHLDNLEYDCLDQEYGVAWLEDRVKANSVLYENYQVVNPEEHLEACREVTNVSFDTGEEMTHVVKDLSRSVSLTSDRLTFNDVLNFMDYYAACREKWCSAREDYKSTLIVPLRDRDGEIKKVSYHIPYLMTAVKKGASIYVQLNMNI